MNYLDTALANAIEAEAKAKERFDNNQIRIWDWLKFKKRIKDIEQEIVNAYNAPEEKCYANDAQYILSELKDMKNN